MVELAYAVRYGARARYHEGDVRRLADAVNLAPHDFEKSARLLHDDRATSRSGRAMSAPNRASSPSRL